MEKRQRKESINRYKPDIDQLYMTVQPEFTNIFKIVDYSQNIYFTKFTSEKPGDTYYKSPLNVHQSGIVYV